MRTSGNFHTEWLYFFFLTRWMVEVWLGRQISNPRQTVCCPTVPRPSHTVLFTAYLVITSAASALQNNWVIVLSHRWESCESVRVMSLTLAWKGNHGVLVISHSWECNSVAIVWGSHPTPLVSCHSPPSVNGLPWCLSPSRGFLILQKTKQDLTLYRHLDFLACTHRGLKVRDACFSCVWRCIL